MGSLRDAGARLASGAASPTISFESTPLPGDAIAFHGLGVQQPCAGRGVCGKCMVRAGSPSRRHLAHPPGSGFGEGNRRINAALSGKGPRLGRAVLE